MNTHIEAKASVLDVVKQLFSGIFLVGGVVAFYYFSEHLLLYRVLGLLAVVVLVSALFFTTRLGKSVLVFALDARQEVRKMVWPTKDETVRTTLLIFAMVFVVGLLLWLFDMALFWGVRFLTGQE